MFGGRKVRLAYLKVDGFAGSPQASSMISRMRETGIELAIEDGEAGLLAIRVLVSWEPNGFLLCLLARRQVIGVWQGHHEPLGSGLVLEIVPGA